MRVMNLDVASRSQSSLSSTLAQLKGPEMKRSRFTEEQIIGILKEHEAGVSVADLWRPASRGRQ